MPRLIILQGAGKRSTVELDGEVTFVGRSLKNHVKLKDRSVSNRHLKVFRIGRKFFVEDLKSTNGTRVNDQRLVPGEGFELQEGDVIRIGRTRMRIDDLPRRSSIERAVTSKSREIQKGTPLGVVDPERRRPSDHGMLLLRDVSRLIKRSIYLHGFCREVLMHILENLPRIDTGVLVYLDPLKRTVKSKTLIPYSRPELAHRPGAGVSESVIDHVLERGRSIRMLNATVQYAGDFNNGEEKHDIRSILCLPLISNSVLRGALYIHSKNNPCGFREEDIIILDSLGSSLALVFENALGR